VADQAADLRLGQRLGNYLLRSVIGRGGMGTVYRADHIYLKRPVAVKVLHRSYFDQRDARERFLREAQAAGRIDHPNIIGVTDFGEAPDGTVFLVMAHVNGNSLDRVLRHEERLPLFRTLVILSQVTRAMGAAHEQGIIHHDLKPDNIMLQKRVGRREVVRLRGDGDSLIEPEGTFDFVTILDFGASKYLDQAMVGSGVVVGTPTYMAPETARDGVADGRSDIYAVGVVFYEMLTGTVPFEGDEATEVMLKHLREPITPPRLRCPQAEITLEAERTIMKAMAKRPDQRYQSMAELHAALAQCYGSVRFRRSVEVLPPGTPVEALRRPIPLTHLKKRPEADGDAGAVPSDPVPGTAMDAGSSQPLLLTRRKSGKHKTLPLGVPVGQDDLTKPPGKK
jgi:eukaryotic-like serine/threonine-protein kinase